MTLERFGLLAAFLVAGCIGPGHDLPTAPFEGPCTQSFDHRYQDVLPAGPGPVYLNRPQQGFSGGGVALTQNWSGPVARLQRVQIRATWETGVGRNDALRLEVWSIGRGPQVPRREGLQPLAFDLPLEGVSVQDHLQVIAEAADEPAYPAWTSVSVQDATITYDVRETYSC